MNLPLQLDLERQRFLSRLFCVYFSPRLSFLCCGALPQDALCPPAAFQSVRWHSVLQ